MKISVVIPTHDPKFLNETVQSVLDQTHKDWALTIMLNNKAKWKKPIKDPRIEVITADGEVKSIGQIKKTLFMIGIKKGDVVVELDHDDILTPDALTEIDAAFKDKKVKFVYSDFAEFKNKTWEPNLYDVSYGWEYYDFEYQGHKLKAAKAWEPSPAMIGLVFYAPNHVRAWRSSFYEEIGGHDEKLLVCDDHDLCIRTYLADVKMVHIPKCLYLYRVNPGSASNVNNSLIQTQTWRLYNKYINEIWLKWAKDNKLLALDLGARFNKTEGYQSVDLLDADINADLSKKWPFKDNSVGVIRAFDFLEHIADKQHTMSEIYRVLAPGGCLLSFTPSTDGRGAFQDPTHYAYWNQNAFWYWTRKEQAQFIDNKDIRFMTMRLVTQYPTDWHKENHILYVTADLIKLAEGMKRLPGRVEI